MALLKYLFLVFQTQPGQICSRFYLSCTVLLVLTLFLSEFAEFLSDLVLKTDKVMIVGDFNNHVDVKNDSLSTAFSSLLDLVGFCQSVHKPTHCFNHTLDLVLTYGIEIENLVVFSHNPILTDHHLLS